MGRIGLQLRATLENITRLRAEGEDFRWYLKLKCGNCGEVSEKWQYLRLMDSAPLKGGRGSATMVQKCKLCSRENSIDILSQTIKPYNAEDSEKFKTIVEFECRGLEPVDFQPQRVNEVQVMNSLQYMASKKKIKFSLRFDITRARGNKYWHFSI
ncbi:CXXC motif containing zinc binding protein isoform 2-T2 [Phoenicopterus ruber ruber]